MYYFILLAIILLIIFFENIKSHLHNIIKRNEQSDVSSCYSKKSLLTDTEKVFYNYFKKFEPKYIVLPQINLASIVKKNNTKFSYQNELYRNIDFCFFNNDLDILLAIEINDNSHKTYKRKRRDEKVRKILKEANIEILTYNVNYPNTEISVIERAKEILERIDNKK